jgi:hypothetical protein
MVDRHASVISIVTPGTTGSVRCRGVVTEAAFGNLI